MKNLRRLLGSALLLVAPLVTLGATPAAADPPRPMTVMLDPGHGGSNLGAPGHVEGVREKKLTLALARLIRQRLEHDGVSVMTTRDSDVYLTLPERVRLANAAGAAAFVSLHANATPGHETRGFKAFINSREVNDIEAHRAGANGDLVDGMVARARVRQVARESARLAQLLRNHLSEVRTGDLGTRQFAYDVLEGPQMPATLLEIGFIDHPVEGVELLRPEVLRQLAGSIAEGIEDFLAHQS